MFCQECGAQLRDSARFCNQCGHIIRQRFADSQPSGSAAGRNPRRAETLPAPPEDDGQTWSQWDEILEDDMATRPRMRPVQKVVFEPPPPAQASAPVIPSVNPPVEYQAQTMSAVRKKQPERPPDYRRRATLDPVEPEFFTGTMPATSNPRHDRLLMATGIMLLVSLALMILLYIAGKYV
ncbi:MAG: zinc ribbon domain-containing protein [Blastocatellia bacterium]